VFLLQLAFSVLLHIAKLVLKADRRNEQRNKRSQKDPKHAAIANLHKWLHRTYPTLPGRRCLDTWEETTTAALARSKGMAVSRGWRCDKQPKLSLDESRKVTWGQLRKIVRDFEYMKNLREELFSPSTKSGEGFPQNGVEEDDANLLDRMLAFLANRNSLSDHEVPKVRQIVAAANRALALVRDAARPQEHQKNFRREPAARRMQSKTTKKERQKA